MNLKISLIEKYKLHNGCLASNNIKLIKAVNKWKLINCWKTRVK